MISSRWTIAATVLVAGAALSGCRNEGPDQDEIERYPAVRADPVVERPDGGTGSAPATPMDDMPGTEPIEPAEPDAEDLPERRADQPAP